MNQPTTDNPYADILVVPGGAWHRSDGWHHWHWVPDNAPRSMDNKKKRMLCGRMRGLSNAYSYVPIHAPHSILCPDCVGMLRSGYRPTWHVVAGGTRDEAFIELQRDTAHLEYCSDGCSFEHKRDYPDMHQPANCLICGEHRPRGHVMTTQPGNRFFGFGRICSGHTLFECAQAGFYLTIDHDRDE
jgi:hypothetical protein